MLSCQSEPLAGLAYKTGHEPRALMHVDALYSKIIGWYLRSCAVCVKRVKACVRVGATVVRHWKKVPAICKLFESSGQFAN